MTTYHCDQIIGTDSLGFSVRCKNVADQYIINTSRGWKYYFRCPTHMTKGPDDYIEGTEGVHFDDDGNDFYRYHHGKFWRFVCEHQMLQAQCGLPAVRYKLRQPGAYHLFRCYFHLRDVPADAVLDPNCLGPVHIIEEDE